MNVKVRPIPFVPSNSMTCIPWSHIPVSLQLCPLLPPSTQWSTIVSPFAPQYPMKYNCVPFCPPVPNEVQLCPLLPPSTQWSTIVSPFAPQYPMKYNCVPFCPPVPNEVQFCPLLPPPPQYPMKYNSVPFCPPVPNEVQLCPLLPPSTQWSTIVSPFAPQYPMKYNCVPFCPPVPNEGSVLTPQPRVCGATALLRPHGEPGAARVFRWGLTSSFESYLMHIWPVANTIRYALKRAFIEGWYLSANS